MLHLRRVHFGLDSDTLRPEAREALAEAAERLRAYPGVEVYVEGHCDQRGTSEYNVALGENRARAAIDYLANLGLERSRLHNVSYGEDRPIDAQENSRAYARNRRVDFALVRGDVRLVIDEGVLLDDQGNKLAAQAR